MDNPNQNTCYICLYPGDNLLRPCVNTRCKGRVHRECIALQYTSDNTKCGICRSNIFVNDNNTKKFDTNTCCKQYLKIIYNVFIIIVGSISIILLALGKTLASWTDCEYGSSDPCDGPAVGTIFFTIPLVILFWQFPMCCCCKYNIFCCGSLKQRINHKSYITMGILFLVAIGLVVLAHVIGYPIIKYMFDKDEFFTWRTSTAGFVVYCILVGFGVLCLIIFGILYCTYANTIEMFSVYEEEYGVVLTDDLEEIHSLQ